MNNNTILTATVNENIGELRGLLAASRAQGLSVAILKIPVHLFAIDKAYQTIERTGRDLDYLVNDFKKEKLLPVTGVPHDEEGKIYLVDGYGRWKASQIVDERCGTNEYKYLDCMVILNAPTEPVARRKYEAEMYALQNKNVAKVTPLQKHGAYRCLENDTVFLMDKMKEKYGFLYNNEAGDRSVGIVKSYTEVFNICKNHKEACIDYIFDICRRSGFNMKTNGYAVYVIRTLKDVWRLYPDNREETSDFLSNWLRKIEPIQFKASATAKYGMLDYNMACSLYIEDLLVDNIGISHVRAVNGKSVKIIPRQIA